MAAPGWLRRRVLPVVLAVAAAGLAGLLTARHLGQWLVVADPMEPAPVAVVMAGGVPFRAMEAAALYREGLVPEVWLTRAIVPAREAALARLGVAYVSDDVYNRAVLQRLGVPADRVRVLPDPVDTTPAELAAVARELRRLGMGRAAIVTSPAHTRRVRMTWRAVVGSSPRAIVRPARESPHDLARWWQRKSAAKVVVREWLGILNVWAGFPLRGDID